MTPGPTGPFRLIIKAPVQTLPWNFLDVALNTCCGSIELEFSNWHLFDLPCLLKPGGQAVWSLVKF